MINITVEVKAYFCDGFVEDERTAIFIPRDATQVDFERHGRGLPGKQIVGALLMAQLADGTIYEEENPTVEPITIDDEWGYRGIYLEGAHPEMETARAIYIILATVKGC